MDGSTIDNVSVTEESLLSKGYRKYRGKNVNIFFNTSICQHSANCVRGNSAVFDIHRKPWIVADNASADEVVTVINACPSGALKFIRKDIS